MNPKLYNILTENQRKKYRKNRKAARKILNVPYGYVMHHKDETLLHTDLDRYVEWRPEDLEITTLSEHSKHHGCSEETKRKLSQSMLGNHNGKGHNQYTIK